MRGWFGVLTFVNPAGVIHVVHRATRPQRQSVFRVVVADSVRARVCRFRADLFAPHKSIVIGKGHGGRGDVIRRIRGDPALSFLFDLSI